MSFLITTYLHTWMLIEAAQIIFLLLANINSIKVDSNLPGSLSRRSERCLKVKLSEIKKTCSSVGAFGFLKIKVYPGRVKSKINIH